MFIAATSLAGSAISAGRLSAARAREQAAGAQAPAVAAQLGEVLNLRAHQEQIAASQRPTEDIYAEFGSAMSEAGLPSACLKDLSPDGDKALESASTTPGPRLRVQSVRLTIEPVTLAQVGNLLASWRTRQPVWRTSSIELNATAPADRPEGSYTVRIVLSATYLGSN
jgi:hypothetical protein